jgi:cytochrome c553
MSRMMSRSFRLAIGVASMTTGVILYEGCGSGDCAESAFSIVFSPMYSAYESGHTYQIPAIVPGMNTSSLTWTSKDPSIATIASDSATGGVMITVHKPGSTTITARGGSLCGTSQLTVTPATAEEWATGEAFYNAAPAPSDGGASGISATCGSCHGETATIRAFKDISHTPQQAGGYSDSDLDLVIRKGVVPDGGYYVDSLVPMQVFQRFHAFSAITDSQLKGIIVYMRSLTPVPQEGKADFGGRGHSDGGRSPRPQDAGAAPSDAGQEDPGQDDAGPADPGPADAGPADAGPADAGPADAGPADAGPADAGPADAGQ